MKAALLGLTHPHSSVLLATLDNLPEITSVLQWDPDPGMPCLPSRKGTGRTADLGRLLADPALVFAVVCVRTDQAAAISREVLAADKHLLAEKPAGLTSPDIADLARLAARRGLTACVLYVRRAHPCMVAARQLVQSGQLGPLLTLEARFLATQVRFRQPESWLFRRAQSGGGILLWLGCHCLDLFYHVTGDEIVSVGAQFAVRSGEAIDVEDVAALTLKFRSGAIGTFHAGYTLAYSGAGYLNRTGNDSYFAVNARNGRIVWPDLDPRLIIETPPPPGGQSPRREESYDFPASDSYGGAGGEQFFRQFIAATAGKASPPAALADALRTARVVEAAQRSSESGRFESVQP